MNPVWGKSLSFVDKVSYFTDNGGEERSESWSAQYLERSGHPPRLPKEVHRMFSRIRQFRRMALTLAPLVSVLLAGGANANWR